MPLTHFDDLLAAAREQAEPQRLLIVLAAAELPPDATPAEREAFARGEGGALAPVLCVDKLADEIAGFAGLRAESETTGVGWDILFVSTLSGRAGIAPNSDEAMQPLKMMVEQIKGGRIGRFLAANRDGELVSLRSR